MRAAGARPGQPHIGRMLTIIITSCALISLVGLWFTLRGLFDERPPSFRVPLFMSLAAILSLVAYGVAHQQHITSVEQLADLTRERPVSPLDVRISASITDLDDLKISPLVMGSLFGDRLDRTGACVRRDDLRICRVSEHVLRSEVLGS